MKYCPTCGRPVLDNKSTWTPAKRAILAELIDVLQQLFEDVEDERDRRPAPTRWT